MTKSESIAQLAEALSKAQGEMKGAIKDSDNPFFKSKYADLASVWEACRGPLTRNGLSVCQMPEVFESQTVLHTILMHSSGEWIASELRMTSEKNTPQVIGLMITYMRRYSLAAITGVAQDDDDGNAASDKTVPRVKEAIPLKPPVPKKLESFLDEALAPLKETVTRSAYVESAGGVITREVPREPGSDDEDVKLDSDYIDIGRQRNLHRAFREALKNPDAKAKADIWLEQWLKHVEIVDAEGRGSTTMIPTGNFDSVKKAAIKYAASLPQ